MTRLLPIYLFVLAGGLLLTGCGGPPANNPLLEEARLSVADVSNDPEVASKAPVALEEAEAHLRRSERLLRDKAEPADVTHHAYMAQQYVAIARERAALKTAEESVKRAEIERKEVQLKAREVQAQQAEERAALARAEAAAKEQDARQAQREAEEAKLQAEAAIARAEELAKRVAELEAKQTERGLVLTLSDVLFDVDKASLKAGGLRAVDQLATFMKEYPERTVLIEGHTDNTGSDAYNLGLSQRRAQAVQAALLERGIASNRIRTIGFGEDYPLATNATTAGRQQNRRVEVVISDEQGHVIERAN